MNKGKQMDYRAEIYKLRIKRIWLALKMELSYSALSSRLAGFIPWQPGEEEKLKQIIKEAKKAK